jgi:hypothetical protein
MISRISMYFIKIRFVPLTILTEDQSLYFTYYVLLSSATVWLTILLASVIAIIPDIILSVIEDVRENRLFEKLERMNNLVMANKKRYSNSHFFIKAEAVEKPKNYRVYPSNLFEKPVNKLNQFISNSTNNAIYI